MYKLWTKIWLVKNQTANSGFRNCEFCVKFTFGFSKSESGGLND